MRTVEIRQTGDFTFDLVERDGQPMIVGHTQNRRQFMSWVRTLTDDGTPFTWSADANGYSVEKAGA